MADESRPRLSFLRRRRTWLVLLGVLVAVRAALPEVIRRVARSQVAERLQTRVEIGDVDLSFLRPGVALENVEVYSPTPLTPDEPPLVSWERFAVSLRWLPLFWKTVQLRQIVLDRPRIALDRLADGELNLRRLIPVSETAPGEPPPADAEPSTWSTGIDRFVLRAGGVRFRDFTLAGGEPLEIAIPDVTVDDVALRPGVYGEPGRLNVRVKTEGGSVRVASRIWILPKGFATSTRVKAFRMPLRRARLYVPGMGWSELQGEVDAVVDHGLAPEGKNSLDATIRVRDVAIRVPDLPNAALAVRRLAVRIAPLDLGARRVHVRQVDLAGAAVVVDLHTDAGVLPVVRGGKPASPPAEAAPESAAAGSKPSDAPEAAPQPAAEPPPSPPAAPEPPPAESEPPPADAPPFRWRVDEVRLSDSKVSLVQEGDPLDIGVEATVRKLADEGDPGRLDVKLAVPPGSVAVAGALRPMPPGFGGTVRIDQLPVHDLVRAARAAAQLPPGLTKHALLGVDLALEAGLTESGAAAAPAGAVRAKGTVGIEALQMEGPDPSVFAVSWKRFAVPIDSLELPGVMPGAPAGARGPIKMALGAVRLEEPSVQLTRTPEGLVLPPPLGGAPSADGAQPTPAAAGQPATAGAKPAPAAAAPADPAAPAPDVTIASFVLAKGRIGVVDRSVKPHFTGEIKPLDISARGIRSAGPSVEQLTLNAATPAKGKLSISGSAKPTGGAIKVNADALALAPYNPYVTAFSPYSLGRASSVSVKTEVKYAKNKYDTKTALTLHKLTVKGAAGDTVFKQQFGIPLSMALALLRDPSGNIKLDIPVAVDEAGTKIGLGTVVAGALRSALLGAVTSPLKAVGFALGSGDGDALEPPPIPAEVGRAVLTAEGEKQVGQLAQFLGSRPGVGLELDAVVTAADARWLKEQALRMEFESRRGVGSALRDLPERRVRGRVGEALAERAAGEKGELDDDDREKLDEWLAERPDVGQDGLAKLARERSAAVATLLRERHGIPAERVTIGDPKGEVREGEPSVVVAFGGAEE
jgi:hypothetical protein